MNAPQTGPNGILLVDKSPGWTSHDAVARTRRLAGTRKVGHAGTLDPMATGLLVLGLGSSTRLLTYIVGADKEYLATIRLGVSTTTDDADGLVVARADASAVTAVEETAIAHAVGRLTGPIEQVPSSVSAIKVEGKRAYARVRAGETVELASRSVTISAFDVLASRFVIAEDGMQVRDLDVRVECSSGTYIRALARDLGARLGVGGHLTALRRTRVGPFDVRDAAPLEDTDPSDRILSPADAASLFFTRLELSEQQAIDLGHGKPLQMPDGARFDGPVAAIAPSGRLVGLLRVRGDEGRPLVNFPPGDAEEGGGR